MSRRKTFHLESLGCAKNQVDSERVIACLEREGWDYVAEPQAADVILVNTCAFTDDAQRESVDTSLRLRADFPHKCIVMTGCLPQRYGATLHREMKEIDGFLGDRDQAKSHQLLLKALSGERPLIVEQARSLASLASLDRTRLLSYPGSAYVKVAEGCSNHCSYCAIPGIRGELISRPRRGIVDEVRSLVARGVVELNLVAQDLGSYGVDQGQVGLCQLLREIATIKATFWIRLLYIHPDHFPEGILDLVADDPRFLPYFDIPFQHASKRILSAMGRQGDSDTYLKLISRIRQRLPHAVVRSTFLVGFPGEDDEDFSRLLDFQKRAALDWLGVFVYSPQAGTRSYTMKPKVPKGKALSRKLRLEQAQIPVTGLRLERFLGRPLDVIVEEKVASEQMVLARGYPQAPEVDGSVVVKARDLLPGQLVRVRITRRNGFDLEGEA